MEWNSYGTIRVRIAKPIVPPFGKLCTRRGLDPCLEEAHYTLGVIYWQSGDFEQAAREMQAAIAIRPDDPDAYLMLASALNKKGDLDGAESALQSAIRLDPANPGPYNTLGEVLKRKGDIEGSRQAFAAGARAIEKKNRELGKMLQKKP